MSLTHVQLREKFAKFWEKNSHKEIPPIPLIPQNDPTTLFTGSGMQQLVPYLLGETHPLGKRVYNIQPCFRSQDIEEVGDNRHTTFFEMMGNWSLGDYFKKEQISWFWEFLTSELGLPKDKLYVTIFAGDKKNNLPPDVDSIEIWKKLGLPENRIFKYGPEKNWWSRAGVPDNMPAGEPGGPDSEVFYEFTQVTHDKKFGEKCHPNCDCGRFMEIGNCVFMQYKKAPSGDFQELPAMNVDFGGGLERILAALNDDPDVFLTSVFKKIIEEIEINIFSKFKYTDKNVQYSFRILADHIKAASFLLFSGITPSNKAQGYVLRRLLRKSVMQVYKWGDQKNKISTLINPVIDIYKNGYPEIEKLIDMKEIIDNETDGFMITLKKALDKWHKLLSSKSSVPGPVGTELVGVGPSYGPITPEEVFEFITTYGLPLDIIVNDLNWTGDFKKVEKLLNEHKTKSRAYSVGMFKGGLADHAVQTIKYHTATHLLHQALFDVLGSDVRQEGSNITVERLRFDFYSIKKLEENDLRKIEEIINQKIKESLPVEFKIVPKDEALKIGARSFFREKYPEMVKVYFVGSYSKEFCGGPHVKNTSEIGSLKIYKFEKIGSNLYRIYAK